MVVLEIEMGEKHLADLHAVAAEKPLVLVDEPCLPDGRAHLDVVHVSRSRLEPKRLDACGDCARRDEEHLVPGLPKGAQLRDKTLKRRVVGLPGLVRNRMRANFHYDSHKLRYYIIFTRRT